jgi:hypothetical protein
MVVVRVEIGGRKCLAAGVKGARLAGGKTWTTFWGLG